MNIGGYIMDIQIYGEVLGSGIGPEVTLSTFQ